MRLGLDGEGRGEFHSWCGAEEKLSPSVASRWSSVLRWMISFAVTPFNLIAALFSDRVSGEMNSYKLDAARNFMEI